jgi:hypothetical protein
LHGGVQKLGESLGVEAKAANPHTFGCMGGHGGFAGAKLVEWSGFCGGWGFCPMKKGVGSPFYRGLGARLVEEA